MIANYHTHTPRCRHADGTETEYAQAAVDAGLQILGFSDHTPFWFPDGYYTHMRMYPEQFDEYCDSVRAAAKQFAGKLQIHLGLEVEYYPAFLPRLVEEAQARGVEYFILGQHWLGNEINEPYNGKATAEEINLSRYCKQLAEAMNTGLFTYLAHPDLIFYTGDDRIYEKHMRQLCREANSCAVPLEINLLGLHGNRNYPDPRFWQIAAEENCRCVIGCDAHAPWAIHNTPALEKAMALVQRYDLKLMDTVPLRPIG